MANEFLFSERELEEGEDDGYKGDDKEGDEEEKDNEDQEDESDGDEEAAAGQGKARGDRCEEAGKVGDLLDVDEDAEPDSFGAEVINHGAENPDAGQKYEYNSEDSVDTRHQKILEAKS